MAQTNIREYIQNHVQEMRAAGVFKKANARLVSKSGNMIIRRTTKTKRLIKLLANSISLY
jgi:hypothetical protein